MPQRILVSCLNLSILLLPPVMARGQETVDFSRQVRPILSDKCFKCHGPDETSREGDLRLDRAEDAAAVLSSKKPADSELLRRILSKDADERMPPADSKLSLSKAEVETLARWIKQGAKYEQHWAFRSVGVSRIPQVQQTNWPRTPLDFFVLADLEKRKFAPAQAATRERLIRRLSFDLTGLPPTLAEIDSFLNDKSVNAYEKIVDRLLSQKEFGERMAMNWLDVARYADSYGYQVDRDRHVWPWRDWVIKAINNNMPFDQFITWQLAGDLLPKATDEQILATTFNRLHSQKVEGGSTPEEFRVEYVADRNHTFATAFLGLTLECARCHDHKYDPITQKEYYQFFAFFNNIDEAGLYSYFTNSVPTPTLLLTNDAQKKQIQEARAKIQVCEKELRNLRSIVPAHFKTWLTQPEKSIAVQGQVKHLNFEDHKGGANASVAGKVGKAIRLSGDDGFGVGVGNFTRFQPFSISLWMNTPDVKERAVVFHRSRAWTDSASRGYQVLLENGKLSWSLIHFWPGNAIRIRCKEALPTKSWQHVTVTYDGSSRAGGLQIYLNGRRAETEVVRDNLYKNITGSGGNNITIGQRFRDRGFTNGLVDEFRVFNRKLADVEIAHLFDGKSLKTILANKDAAILEPALRDYYQSAVNPSIVKKRTELQTLRQQQFKIVDGLQEIMVMREMAKRRSTFLLKRGAYDAPSDLVPPLTPAAFPAFAKNQPSNRLGLSRWLTDPTHPLTSRVAVNRLWQMFFGQGLVRTPEDFGSQGQPPTHPALLDWMARDFVQHSWDVKRMVKQLVMSATYRQSATGDPKLVAADPTNRLLGRSSRHRWSAEMLRDNALAVSGLLVQKIGGAPAKPYEVALSFKPSGRDKGQGLYRRSLYTYWKRTAPAPVMMSLDASKREVCVVKRERTSSPLQAIVMMNDTQFVEAARVLSAGMVKKHAADSAARITEIFRLLTSRRPRAKEHEILTQLYTDQLAYFQTNKGRAQELLKVGDASTDASLPANQVAALAVVATAVMNFDECVLKP